jgi:hypothetical protein
MPAVKTEPDRDPKLARTQRTDALELLRCVTQTFDLQALVLRL